MLTAIASTVPRETLQDPEREIAHQQDQRDEEWAADSGSRAEKPPTGLARRIMMAPRCDGSDLVAGAKSLLLAPEGQRISIRSIAVALPRPKCSRRWFCAQKPLPPDTSCNCCCPFQKTRTCAPIALRLLACPSNSNSIHWFRGTRVSVEQNRAILVGNHGIQQRHDLPKSAKSDGAPIVDDQ